MRLVTPRTAAARLGRLSALAPLKTPSFRRYWVGLILYVLGWRIETVTFAWLVWQLTADPLYLGYLGLAQGVPVLLFQLLGGVLADRVERLRLLVSTQFVTATNLAVACALTASGLILVEHTLLLSAIGGVFRAFEQPSRQAVVPQLVEQRILPSAIALGAIPWQGGRVVGPAIAGVVIAAFGPATGFGLAAVAYFVAIWLYSRVRLLSPAPASPTGSMLQTMLEGFAFVGRHSLFAMLIGLTFANSLFGMSYEVLLPIFADDLHSGSEGYGLMQAAVGLGALGGTVTLAAIGGGIRHRGRTLLLGGIGFGLLLVALSFSPSLALAVAVLALMGYSNTFYLTLVNTVLQQEVPEELRGRVMSIYGLCWNLIPIGGLLGGLLASAVDARFAVLVGGAIVAALCLLLLAFADRLRQLA